MAINFEQVYGGKSAANGNSSDRKDAQLWLNVGYQTEVDSTDVEGGTETLFVSLPYGIPLDTQNHFDASRISNANMAELRAAQNELLDQIMDVANALEPGEERIIAVDKNTGLCVQIRRRKAAAEAPATGQNRLSKKLKIAA